MKTGMESNGMDGMHVERAHEPRDCGVATLACGSCFVQMLGNYSFVHRFHYILYLGKSACIERIFMKVQRREKTIRDGLTFQNHLSN